MLDIYVVSYTNVDDDGEHLLENVSLYRWVIVSYDVTRRKRSVAVRVAEYVYGKKITVQTKRGPKTYRYQGIITKRSVERIGQSVLMMWEKDAEDFHKYLTGLGIPHTRLVVYLDF